MPNAVFVPAQLNDLSVDVSVGTPAQGAVLYRGAAKWNALATGSAGQVLATQGANADPDWVDMPDLSVTASLAPSSTDRNLIQPTGDGFHALVLKGHSPTQSGDLFQTRDSVGGLTSRFTADGALSLCPGDPAITGRRLSIAPRQNEDGIFVKIPADYAGNLWAFASQDPAIGTFFAIAAPNLPDRSLVNAIGGVQPNNPIFNIALNQNQTADWFQVADYDVNDRFHIKPDMTFVWYQQDAANAQQIVGTLATAFADNTHASWKGRLTLNSADKNGATREGLRIEGTGSGAAIGVLGHAAQAQQTLPANASDLASAITLVNAIKSQVCQGFGFAA